MTAEHRSELRTLRAPPATTTPPPPVRWMLTIAMHPQLRRIGERVVVPDAGAPGVFSVSRLSPEFRTTDGRTTGALADPFVSRSPLEIVEDAGGAVLRASERSGVAVEGRLVAGAVRVDAVALQQGVLIDFAGRVLLVLHLHSDSGGDPPKYGLVGESAAIEHLREEITLAAVLPISVLIRGESGTGKELVARAIHAASPRAAQPYIALNMAALNPQTAVSELFGHTRGSFTGAVQARDGYFREAHGGTLFLDEIGEAPAEVRAMLLRVLENGEVQPVGGGPARRVDVRVIAATDADLAAPEYGAGFRQALLHRLAGLELHVPPLRRRVDDVMRLLVHFLAGELRRAGYPERFAALAVDASPVLSTRTVARLLRDPWPGNVRQLGNVARQMTAALLVGRSLEAIATTARATPPALEDREAAPRVAGDVSNEHLMLALGAHHWNIRATAKHLGVSRNTLYARMERCPGLRKARDIEDAELTETYRRHDGDLERVAEDLRVSLRGLQLRLRELKLVQ